LDTIDRLQIKFSIAGFVHLQLFNAIARDVKETLGPETETFGYQQTFGYLSETRPRRDPPKIFRERHETETFDLGLETRPRPSEAEMFFSRPFRLTVSLYYNNRYIHYTDNMRQFY
jgi:hypothetical protein